MLSDSKVFITGGAGFIGSTLGARTRRGQRRDAVRQLQQGRAVVDISGRPSSGHGRSRRHLGSRSACREHSRPHPRRALRRDRRNRHGQPQPGDDHAGQHDRIGQRARGSHASGSCRRIVCFSTSEIFGRRAFRVERDRRRRDGRGRRSRDGRTRSASWPRSTSPFAYHTEFGLPVTVVRPFNVYGPGQVGEGAMRTFVTTCPARRTDRHPRRRLANSVRGATSTTWCAACCSPWSTIEAVGHSFNIGNARAVATMTSLAETVVRVTGSSSRIEFVHRGGADVELRVPRVDHGPRTAGLRGHRRSGGWDRPYRSVAPRAVERDMMRIPITRPVLGAEEADAVAAVLASRLPRAGPTGRRVRTARRRAWSASRMRSRW